MCRVVSSPALAGSCWQRSGPECALLAFELGVSTPALVAIPEARKRLAVEADEIDCYTNWTSTGPKGEPLLLVIDQLEVMLMEDKSET